MKRLLLPLVFVFLYGSGFVGAKYGLPYSPPLTMLSVRFALAATLTALFAACLRASWPRTLRETSHITIAGLLTVGTFSAGVFESINWGISPALSALIIAMQPLFVAVLAPRIVGETISRRQWIGLALGFLGVAIVVGHKIRFDSSGTFGLAFSIVGLVGLTCGNLYQKRFCAGMDVLTGGAIQSATSALVMLLLALACETIAIQWTLPFVGALLYMAVGVSIGALTLLYLMIRRGEVSRVASVFYLVPVSAAVTSFLLFGERFDTTVVFGVCVVAVGVLLVNLTPAVACAAVVVRPITLRLSSEDLSSTVRWEQHGTQGRQGALIHEIYRCGSPTRRMAIVRFTPGSSAAVHRHASYETIFIIDGSYHDDFGEHVQGDLVVYPPRSEHSWRSPGGAMLLVVWDGPTEMATQQSLNK